MAEQLGLNVADINNDASFMDDLGADSLDLVELVMAFESNFGITILMKILLNLLLFKKQSTT